MEIKLSAAGNPDFDQAPSLGIPTTWVEVESLEQASQVARAFITKHNLGSGNWTGGQVVDTKGRAVAQISYNGRIWSPSGQAI